MSPRRRKALQFEPLEGKQLLSTVKIAAPAPRAEVQARARAQAAAPAPFSIEGTLRTPVKSIETYVSDQGNKVGTFKLSGKLRGTGQVKGTFLAILDDQNQMKDTGGITLTNRRGSVILLVTNDPVDETSYLFTITSGTGKFAGVAGSGKLSTSGAARNGRTLFFSAAMSTA